jgi:hypothetical protein
VISLLIMKNKKHSSYGMKSFLLWDECFLQLIINNEIIYRFWYVIKSIGWPQVQNYLFRKRKLDWAKFRYKKYFFTSTL